MVVNITFEKHSNIASLNNGNSVNEYMDIFQLGCAHGIGIKPR